MGGINCHLPRTKRPGDIIEDPEVDRIKYSKVVGYIFSSIENFSKANVFIENIMELEQKDNIKATNLLSIVIDSLDKAVSYNSFAKNELSSLINDADNKKVEVTNDEVIMLKRLDDAISKNIKNISCLSTEYSNNAAVEHIKISEFNTYIRYNNVTDLTQNIVDDTSKILSTLSSFSKATRRDEYSKAVSDSEVSHAM